MARPKKNFDVEEFRKWVNAQLAKTEDGVNDDFKRGIGSAWEHVAHETGNYRGYQNLYWINEGFDLWVEAGKPEDWDAKKKFITSELLGENSRVYF